MTEPETRVIFRAFRDSGDVIAFFPDLDEGRRGLCLSYMHVGQHGACSYHALISGPWPARTPTRPAMPHEWADLAAELASIGYRLRVIRRWPTQRREAPQ